MKQIIKWNNIFQNLLQSWVLIFLLPFTSFGQTSEMDQVKMIPSVDETNMRLIALTMWNLYEEALKSPESSSTPRAVQEVVYSYYDTDFEGRHEKLRSFEGKKYECTDRKQLDSNNRLMFNLRFDTYGNIMLPDSVYMISNRVEEREGKIYTLGLISFGVKVPDEIREKLMKAKLERVVKSRMALGGEYPAVEVIVPFNLARRTTVKDIAGRILLDDDRIDFLPEAQSSMGENETEILKHLGEMIEYKMLQYKKGEFIFLTEHTTYAYQIDLNIRRNTVWHSQQTKNFSLDVYKVLSFTGSGEKTKQYVNAQKAMTTRLTTKPKAKK